MLRTDLPDHRRATEEALVAALGDRDPLALAEAYHRTIPSAHAVARRLLAGSNEVEALLRAVYAELWSSPPRDAALEGWLRARCFAMAAEDLRERDAAPASPSLTTLLPELPRPEVRYLDAAERALSDLPDDQRRALLLAHDRGVPSDDQDVADAGAALVAALLALAGDDASGGQTPDPSTCADITGVGDWVLGLLPPQRAEQVAADLNARPECAAVIKALRRGRRRLEGLPPTPDMGQRVLVVVLAGGPPPAVAASPQTRTGVDTADIPSALDAGPAVAALPEEAEDADRDGDTGELSAVGAADGEGRRDASGVYAELAELDETADTEPPVAEDDHIEDADDGYADYDAPYTVGRRRSMTGRLLMWLLGALFLAAGVAAGLYLGLTLLG